jgi:hypothetical protein
MRELYDALLGASMFNLLHFNTAFERATDNAIADNVGWLDFTHALTFANAFRHIQRIWRPLQRLAADVTGSADRPLPGPPRIGAVIECAGLAVENAGVVLVGQRDIILAVG